METTFLGNLFLNEEGMVIRTGESFPYAGGSIELEDTCGDLRYALPWYRLSNGVLIAQWPLVTGISYQNLMELGLINGCHCEVDGLRFLLTSPSLGKGGDWEMFLHEVGEDDKLIHWSAGLSFCRQGERDETFVNAVGINGPRSLMPTKRTHRRRLAGWRPVLVPMEVA